VGLWILGISNHCPMSGRSAATSRFAAQTFPSRIDVIDVGVALRSTATSLSTFSEMERSAFAGFAITARTLARRPTCRAASSEPLTLGRYRSVSITADSSTHASFGNAVFASPGSLKSISITGPHGRSSRTGRTSSASTSAADAMTSGTGECTHTVFAGLTRSSRHPYRCQPKRTRQRFIQRSN
jgi:hypothetical protein